MEHRHNWKEDISREAQQKAQTRQALILSMKEISEKIRTSDLSEYDSLMAQKREIMAILTTL